MLMPILPGCRMRGATARCTSVRNGLAFTITLCNHSLDSSAPPRQWNHPCTTQLGSLFNPLRWFVTFSTSPPNLAFECKQDETVVCSLNWRCRKKFPPWGSKMDATASPVVTLSVYDFNLYWTTRKSLQINAGQWFSKKFEYALRM